MRNALVLLASIVALILTAAMVYFGHMIWGIVFMIFAVIFPAYIGME